MLCETVRKGNNCPFMSKAGCGYADGVCLEVVEQCKGCNRVVEYASKQYCGVFPDPAAKWKLGHCNMATHVSLAVAAEKVAKVNPLKASKRSKK